MTTAIATYRPGLLGRTVFDTAFDAFFNDFPSHLRQSTQGYPVADIYQDVDGNTVLEFALAGFTREQLNIGILPADGSITVSASATSDEDSDSRRIARRSFKKTYVDFDGNLDLTAVTAKFRDGLLRVIVPQRPEVKPLSVSID